jgi:hypothetical protein
MGFLRSLVAPAAKPPAPPVAKLTGAALQKNLSFEGLSERETAMATGGKVHPQTAMTYGLLHEIGSSVVWMMRAEKAIAPEFTVLLDTGKSAPICCSSGGCPIVFAVLSNCSGIRNLPALK